MQSGSRIKKINKKRRQGRIRAKLSGTASRPRLSVFRSLRHISAQVIDDSVGKTVCAVSDIEVKDAKGSPVDLAFKVGEAVAQKAIKAGIKTVVFDRGGFQYHGRVKAVAEGARKGGLEF